MKRQDLIDCFRDTLERSTGKELRERTAWAVQNSSVYPEGFRSPTPPVPLPEDLQQTGVTILSCTTLEAARQFLGFGRTAVLNFANPEIPGGAVARGAVAQEEDLCRCSNLYQCLLQDSVQEGFYRYHRVWPDQWYSDRLIYSRDVTVFKDGAPVPRMLRSRNWFSVDVISCSAPYQLDRLLINPTAAREVFKSRIRAILESAVYNGAVVLILGAFGCGAFRNPPEIVARAFREVLIDEGYLSCFARVVFAIKPPVSGRAYHFDVFSHVFSEPSPKHPAVWPRQVSIVGDSISTLEGCQSRNTPVFYRGLICERAGIRSVGETWWGITAAHFGWEVLVNDAWSGGRVTRLPDAPTLYPAGCSDERTSRLHVNVVTPDVILVCLGLNDWANGVPLTAQEGREETESFSAAYDLMLSRLRWNYPHAEIYCCTLPESFQSKDPSFVFPTSYAGIHIRDYCEIIRSAAAMHGCRVLDLHAHGVRYDTLDGTHPNADGMRTLADLLIAELEAAGVTPDLSPAALEEGAEQTQDLVKDAPVAADLRFTAAVELFSERTGEILHASGSSLLLGRDEACDVRLRDIATARRHAQLQFDAQLNAWLLRDLHSANGTYLNGERLRAGFARRVYNDDLIRLGREELRFYAIIS